jgi:GNAT superfamily N-acetyltransferase
VELREITDENRDAVLALRVAPQQERFVSSVEDSLHEAVEYAIAKPWYRAVYSGSEPVGFVMISWNLDPVPPDMIGPWFLWKLLVDSRHQRLGYGRDTIGEIVSIVRREGGAELLTSCVEGEGGPYPFYLGFGFVPTGDRDASGEVILRLTV